MKLYYPITIDLYKVYPLKVMEAQQGNVGRGAVVTLTAGGAVVDPSGEVVEVYAKKPDGTVSWLECSIEDTKIKIDFTNQMLMSPGTLQLELRMMNDTDDITTPIFLVKVNKSNVQSAGRSENELPVLDELKKDVSRLSEEVYETVYDTTTTIDSATLIIGNQFRIGDLIEVSCDNTSSKKITINTVTGYRYIRTNGNGIPYKQLIDITQSYKSLTFEAGWTVRVKRSLVQRNTENINKLSEEVTSLKQNGVGGASSSYDETTGNLTINSSSLFYDEETGNLTI